MQKNYLDKHVFHGLKNLNSGFDAEAILYFSEKDFATVLERCESLGVDILGIEPWKDGEFYDVLTFEDFNKSATDPSWYIEAFKVFSERDTDLQYAATYFISENLLKD